MSLGMAGKPVQEYHSWTGVPYAGQTSSDSLWAVGRQGSASSLLAYILLTSHFIISGAGRGVRLLR